MKQIQVVPYTADKKTEWDNFVQHSKNGTFLFYRDFMEYHQDRFDDFSLLIYQGKKLIAVLPANRVGEKLYSHQGLTYGGLVLSEKIKLFDAFDAFKAVLHFLYVNGITSAAIKIIPTFYNSMPADELEYFLYKAQAKLIKKDVLMVIDYQHKLRFQKNRREGINRAKRNQLQLKIEDKYDEFWNKVLIPNLKERHGVNPVHSLSEIKRLASKFPKHIQQVNVYKDGELVAGTTVFLTKTTIHPQYVSASENRNATGSLDLLYDFLINHYRDDKRYFDFNISSEENGKILNQGLIYWKETCGARAFTADNYEIKTQAYKNLSLQTL